MPPQEPRDKATHGQTYGGRVAMPGDQHPDEWRGDMNPTRLDGQNLGPSSAAREKEARTAYDIKDLHNRLSGFPDDLLKQIPVLPPKARLQQGATYVDLNDPNAQEFTAAGNMEAAPNNYYVPKSEVDHLLWNRLIGVETPERVGDPSE